MRKVQLKEIRWIGGEQEVFDRVKKWQVENHCSGIPRAGWINLECVAYSAGVYGCNGSLFQDTKTGKLYGCPGRSYAIYIR